MIPLPPCDHDGCSKTGCAQPGSLHPAGSASLADRMFCADCGIAKYAVREPENAWSQGFWIFGCDCDDPDGYGYGNSAIEAERDYMRKHGLSPNTKLTDSR